MPKDPRDVAEFKLLSLTNKHVIKESNDFWVGTTEEIPLHKLDSIGSGYKRNLFLFLIGIVVAIIGFIVLTSQGIFGLILIVIGVVLLAIGLMKREFVELRAGTLKLSADGKGAIEFADVVRDELHKKDYV